MAEELCNCPCCQQGIEAPHEYHLERRTPTPGSDPQGLRSMEAGQLAWDSLADGPRQPLSDEQIKERCEAAGIRWIEPDDDPCGFPGSFDMVSMAEMRALLTHGVALPRRGQP
jgi:hypothetical protein